MMRDFTEIPSSVLKWLRYEPETGQFFWKEKPASKIRIGSRAGSRSNCNGYRVIKIEGVMYYEHRLACYFVYGPVVNNHTIDHRNLIRNDNRIDNLRFANTSEQQCNLTVKSHSKSRIKGVWWCKTYEKWVTQITKNGRKISIGKFDDPMAAKAARDVYVSKMHGEFARLN